MRNPIQATCEAAPYARKKNCKTGIAQFRQISKLKKLR